MNILANFQMSGKNLQLEPLGNKYSDLIEELAPKIMSSSFLKSTFELTQTINSRIDHKMAVFSKVCPKVES